MRACSTNFPEHPARSPSSRSAPARARSHENHKPERELDRLRQRQRPVLGGRLDAAALHRRARAAHDPGRILSDRPRRPGDAVARRHEPGRQGICRSAERRRSGRAGPVAIRRRRRRAHQGADRQSVRPRGNRRQPCTRPDHARWPSARNGIWPCKRKRCSARPPKPTASASSPRSRRRRCAGRPRRSPHGLARRAPAHSRS